MKQYKLELLNTSQYGVIREKKYKVVDYDNNAESLKKFVEELNNKTLFNIDWRIINEEKGILEETIDTLD